MAFSEELRKKRKILGREREREPLGIQVFWGHRHRPKALCITTVTRPEKSTSSFIDGLGDSGREDTHNHGLGKHVSEDRVDKGKGSPDWKGVTTLAREKHVLILKPYVWSNCFYSLL
jgi:hypothetical protein